MQLLRDVAQQARFAAMQPGQITQHYREQDADLQAFELAARIAANSRALRRLKARVIAGGMTSAAGVTCRRQAALHEAAARASERLVREIALQSEIILQRRVEAAEADRAMLGILMGAAS